MFGHSQLRNFSFKEKKHYKFIFKAFYQHQQIADVVNFSFGDSLLEAFSIQRSYSFYQMNMYGFNTTPSHPRDRAGSILYIIFFSLWGHLAVQTVSSGISSL
jgi:hypothetical protein